MRVFARVMSSVSVATLMFTGIATLGSAPAQAQVPKVPPAPSTTSATTVPGTGVPVGTLSWSRCQPADLVPAALECSSLNLPISYENPDTGRFDLQIMRLAARKPTERIGTLFLNPGGPGGSTISFLINATINPGLFSDSIRDKFDLIAFDPRGVIRSNGVTCEPKTQPTQATPPTVPPVNAGADASISAYLASQQKSRSLSRVQSARQRAILLGNAARNAQACLDNESVAFLQSVSTKNVATDMDQLRIALGEEKISFLGFSYGTFLGATYGALFPDHIRALVLDGALPASKFVEDPLQINLEQSASANQILLDIFSFCKSSGAACPFVGADPLTAFRDLIKELDRKPFSFTAGEQTASINGLGLTGITRGLVSGPPSSWPDLLNLLASVQRRDPALLVELITGGDGPPSFSGTAFLITVCNDEDYPDDPEAWDDLYDERFRVAPDFAVLSVFHEVECAYLDYERTRYPGPFSSEGIPTVLVVGGTRDSQTPFAWAQELTQELGNARLLTFDGYGHVSYQTENTCIREKVDAFLITGALPARGTVCTQPKPGTAPPSTPAPINTLPAAGALS
jgi:pimeloyl-ACP methyl ester carboxylesterase